MKNLIRFFVLSVFALLFAATARADTSSLTQFGFLNIEWTVSQQSNPGGFFHGTTNKTATTTNITDIYKATFTNETLNATAILKLLANSFNTNFPAGSRLVTGNGN